MGAGPVSCAFCARPIAGACVAFSAHSDVADVEGPARDKHPDTMVLWLAVETSQLSAGKMRPTTS